MYEDLIRYIVNLKLIKITDFECLLTLENEAESISHLSELSIENVYQSLHFYSTFHPENKSTEYHNLRKASMLGKLYLLHKLCLSNILGKPSKNTFYETCLSYAKQYA